MRQLRQTAPPPTQACQALLATWYCQQPLTMQSLTANQTRPAAERSLCCRHGSCFTQHPL